MNVRFRLGSFVLILLALALTMSMMFEQVSMMPIDHPEEKDPDPYSERDILMVECGILDDDYMFSLYAVWE